MTNKVTKYGLMTIAAVLLVAMAFAGAVSAAPLFPTSESGETVFVNEGTYEGTSLTSGTYVLNGNVTLESENLEISSGAKVKLDLNGYILKGTNPASVIRVSAANLTIEDSSLEKTGIITEGAANGGGISILSNANVTMNGGTIYNCSPGSQIYGAGVMVASGTFTMNDGSAIKDCYATTHNDGSGGAVYVSDGTFTMNGGLISGCTAKKYGGGVLLQWSANAFFVMNGGTIENCRVTSHYSGGGIAALSGKGVVINGGEISGCSSPQAGNGIYMGSGNLTISGKTIILDEVYLSSGKEIIVSGSIADGSSIKNITEYSYSVDDVVVNVTYVGGTASSLAKYFDVGSDSYYLVPNTGVDDSKLLLASVPVGSSKVSFYDGSNKLAYQIVTNGDYADPSIIPARPLSTFLGWYSNPGCTVSFDFATPITAATSVYGKWVDTTGMDWYNNGVASGIFTITTATELEQFASLVNQGVTFAGQTVKLGADIVLNDETYTFNPDTGLVKVTDGTHIGYVGTGYCGDDSGSNTYFDTVASMSGVWYIDEQGILGPYSGTLNVWTSIGVRNDTSGGITAPFKGTFDGCYHSISGMYYDNTTPQTGHTGFFGYIIDGNLSNFYLNNFLVVLISPTGGNFGAVLGGTRDNTVDTYIRNISASGISINNGKGMGVIAGIAESAKNLTIEQCYVNCSMFVQPVGNCCLAGIIAYVGGWHTKDIFIKNCEVIGNYYGASRTATLVGQQGGNYGGNVTIENCLAFGKVVSPIGGFGGALTAAMASVHKMENSIELCSVVNGSKRVGLAGNYAWDATLLNGNYVADGTLSNANGSSVSSGIFWNNQSFFQNTLGWDFDNVWKMNIGNDNYKLPVLKWQTTPVSGDASYLIPITVAFDTQGGSVVAAQNISKDLNATRPADNPTKAGYTFENWYNESACTGVFDFAARLTADTTAYANWTVNTTTVRASENYAEFGNENITAIRSASGNVVKVLLETVMLVEDEDVVFIADNNSLDVPDLNGYTKVDDIAVFEINASVQDDHSEIVINVTFADAANATANKDKIKFFHYSTTNNDWDKIPLEILNEPEQDGANVTYQIQTTSFSPFGIGIYTAIPQQYTPSSSSKHSGSTVILSEGQVAPTAYATAAPTVAPTAKPTEQPATPTVIATEKPATQPTQQSPAPFVGLLAGLGAAAVLLRLRK